MMRKKTAILIILVLLLCAAPISSMMAIAGTKKSTSEADYTLTVIEDEEVPLSDGGNSTGMSYSILYSGAALAGLVVIFYIGRKAEWNRTLARKEIEVANRYMDKLISEDDTLRK